MAKAFGVLLGVHLGILAACSSPSELIRPVPTNGTWPTAVGPPVRADGADAALPPGANAYVCACVIQVPIECADWCGVFNSGTTPTGDGWCDFGLREAWTCLPTAAGDTTWTYADVQRDCVTRVETVVRSAVRRIYADCPAAAFGCDVRVGCSGVRSDGTSPTQHAAICASPCLDVPLTENAHGDWNLQTATYVPAAQINLCFGETTPRDTAHVCGWL